MLELAIPIFVFCIFLFWIFNNLFELFRNYLKVILTISIFGSTLFNLYNSDFLELLYNWNNPDYSYYINCFFSDIQISFISSTILSSVSIVPLYFMEQKTTKYFELILRIFSINFGTLILILNLNNFETKEIQEMAFNFFIFYYLPGVVAYYFFVYRPRKKQSKYLFYFGMKTIDVKQLKNF